MLYRGVIVDTNDPEKRRRYRVRVAGIHRDDAPADSLRWAEICAPFSAKLAADMPSYQVDDRVYVMFEDEHDFLYPVIVGGWVTMSSGINDLPTENADDYAKGQERWLRIDRNGNKLEISAVPEEDWVKIASGAAEVTVSQVDGSVVMKARSGTVTADSAQNRMVTKTGYVEAETYLITASALTAIGGPNGFLQFVSNYELNLHAGSTVAGIPFGQINIGGYVPMFAGVPVGTPYQTPVVEFLGRVLNLGVGPGEFQHLIPLPETSAVNIAAQAIDILAELAILKPHAGPVEINIDAIAGTISIGSVATGFVTFKSGVQVNIQAPDVAITGATNVDIASGGTVTVTAPAVNVVSPAIHLGP